MNMRSRIHMLTVAAARLEQDKANPALVQGLRGEIKKLTQDALSGGIYTTQDEKRIAHQRNLVTMLPVSVAVDRLKQGMMQRAYDLLWDGDCLGCDAILEFLPSADAEKVLAAWESDQDNKAAKSKFYEGAA